MGILNAVVFYILVSVFARGRESELRGKIFVLALVLGFTPQLVAHLVGGLLGLLVALFATFAIGVLGLMFSCEIPKTTAYKISASYLGIAVVLTLVYAVILAATAT